MEKTEEIRIIEHTMDTLQIVICEDNLLQAEQLEKTIQQAKINLNYKISIFTSSRELLDMLIQKKDKGEPLPDIVFSDIRMPELNGIAFGKAIRELVPECYLIFTTAYEEYAIQGYEARAFRYFLKPVQQEDIEVLFWDILRETGRQKKLIVSDSEGQRVLSLSEILYLSAEDKYTILYTQNEHFMERISLKEYEKLLAPHGFFRIHRKYIVNTYHHKSMGKGQVYLSSGQALPISRRQETAYYATVLQGLKKDLVS